MNTKAMPTRMESLAKALEEIWPTAILTGSQVTDPLESGWGIWVRFDGCPFALDLRFDKGEYVCSFDVLGKGGRVALSRRMGTFDEARFNDILKSLKV